MHQGASHLFPAVKETPNKRSGRIYKITVLLSKPLELPMEFTYIAFTAKTKYKLRITNETFFQTSTPPTASSTRELGLD